jgi:hypothetical protein
VHQVLTNEKYIGNNVFNKVSFKLKQQARREPARDVDPGRGRLSRHRRQALFLRAREIVDARSRHFSTKNCSTPCARS